MELFAVVEEGFRIGLLGTAFWFGFRHGFDWDHIAAITDITSSQEDTRRSMLLATIYAAGHGLVVFVLGVIAIVLGDFIPDSVDAFMGKVVGVTLVLLGLFVFWSLIRHGRDFRMRSRWMLVFAGARRGARWLRGHRAAMVEGGLVEGGLVEVDHDHPHDDTHHPPTPAFSPAPAAGENAKSPLAVGHSHRHRHVGSLPQDPFANYGKGTAWVVGMLHGVGAETPTQVLLFVTAAGVAGRFGGTIMLGAFLLGLFASNTLVALASTFGFLNATRNWKVYATVGVLTGGFSLALGVLVLFGKDSILPSLFVG